MEAFIAMQKYIVKEEKDFGVGVPVTLNEEIAQYESSRIKNVQSYNNWILINIPGKNFFLDVSKPINEQSDEVLDVLMKKEFLMNLFIHEAKIVFDSLDNLTKNIENKKEEIDKIFTEFTEEKYDWILRFPSGLELFNFINSKCITHDKGKSSSLLYAHGIKGCTYKDDTGERFLLFNAKKDIVPVEYRSTVLKDSKFTN